MEAKRAKKMMVFGCAHFPYNNQEATSIFCKSVAHIKPDIVISLGDLLSCDQFSMHPPTWGFPKTQYEDDAKKASTFLDRIQKHCGRLVLIEGNHEYRVNRVAAISKMIEGIHSLVEPQKLLTKDRKCTYIPYGPNEKEYPIFKVNSRVIAVHGWSYAKHATQKHLDESQGMTILHAHSHRVQMAMDQKLWSNGDNIEARSVGCLCHRIPLYGTGSPSHWVNAFILGYLGRHSETLYTIPVHKDFVVLPDGKEIRA